MRCRERRASRHHRGTGARAPGIFRSRGRAGVRELGEFAQPRDCDFGDQRGTEVVTVGPAQLREAVPALSQPHVRRVSVGRVA